MDVTQTVLPWAQQGWVSTNQWAEWLEALGEHRTIPKSHKYFNGIQAVSPIRLWVKNGTEVNHKSLLRHLIEDTVTTFWFTFGDERYRKLNGAFTLLLTENPSGSDDSYVAAKRENIVEMLKKLDDVYNAKHGPYPIIFFHILPDHVRLWIEEQSNAVIHWVDIKGHYPPSLPQELPVFKGLSQKDFVLGEGCATMKWWIEYLHMIRFRMVKQWHEPIYRDFDYALQMDIDSSIQQAKYDVFEQIASNNKTFGYYSCAQDLPGCVLGLNDWTANDYIPTHGVQWRDNHTVWPVNAYWAPFWVLRLEWFRTNPDFLRYIQAVDETGNIYKRRWGEQTVFVLALSLSLPYDQIFWTGGILLFHYVRPFYPARRCPHVGVQPECCNVEEDGDPRLIKFPYYQSK